jgi:hypothetical protein
MKNECVERKDELLEAALTQNLAPELQQHLLACAGCAEELSILRARQEQLDALLPRVTQEAHLSPDFRSRVLAATVNADKTGFAMTWRTWGLAGATAMVFVALLTTVALRSRITPPAPASDLDAAQKLAAWHAPSDVFLETPGNDFLRSTPKLGESYLPVPAQGDKEK